MAKVVLLRYQGTQSQFTMLSNHALGKWVGNMCPPLLACLSDEQHGQIGR